MKKFLAVYIGKPATMAQWQTLSEDQRRERQAAGMKAWKEWTETHQDSILDHGTPLGKTKQIAARDITDTRNELCAYTVVQAESHEAAASLFERHPHFMIFPGDSIEVMECLPLPEGI